MLFLIPQIWKIHNTLFETLFLLVPIDYQNTSLARCPKAMSSDQKNTYAYVPVRCTGIIPVNIEGIKQIYPSA
jgi:hypothetical protein